MKINIEELRTAYAEAWRATEEFVTKNGVSLDEAQEAEYVELKRKLKTAKEALKRGEDYQAEQATAAAAAGTPILDGEAREMADMKKRFSITKFVRSLSTQRKAPSLEGVEAEIDQEGQNELRDAVGHASEGLVLPSSFLRFEKPEHNVTRDHVVGTDSAGGFSVETELAPELIAALRPNLLVESLGVEMMTGLKGNIDFTKEDGYVSTTWEGEQDANAETTSTFSKLNLSPKRLGAKTHASNKLLAQSSHVSDNWIMNRLNMAIKQAVDGDFINNSNGSAPTSLLATAGIGNQDIAANGGALTWAKIVALESAIASANAELGARNYLTTPGVRGFMKTNLKAAGVAGYMMEGNQTNGYDVGVTTQVPSTLEKGSSGAICHAMVYGDFSQALFGQWGGIEILRDPYTLGDTATTRFIVNTWWDWLIKQPAAFAAIKDILV